MALSSPPTIRRRGHYSRFVAYLKIGLPLVAIVLLGTIFLVTSPDDFQDTGLVFTDADRRALGDGLSVNGAAVSGASRSGDTYLFKAKVMFPDSLDINSVVAEMVEGTISLGDNLTILLSSDQAKLDRINQTFEVSGNAHLETSDGYSADTAGLSADLASGTLSSLGRVVAEGPAGKIEAGTLLIQTQVSETGDLSENAFIHFRNGVRLLFTPRID